MVAVPWILAIRPGRCGIYFDNPGGWNLNLGEPTLWPRYLHFVLGALAIGGLGRAIFYHFSRMDEKEKLTEIKTNLKICGWITLLVYGAYNTYGLHRDNQQPLQYQGLAGTIGTHEMCTVCHKKPMSSNGHHRNMVHRDPEPALAE